MQKTPQEIIDEVVAASKANPTPLAFRSTAKAEPQGLVPLRMPGHLAYLVPLAQRGKRAGTNKGHTPAKPRNQKGRR